VARELKHSGLIAQVLRFQAEGAFFRGDAVSAARVANEAAQAAARASDRSMELWARFTAANVAAAATPTKAVATTLAQIGQRAKSAGLAYLSVYCALQQADALLRSGDKQQARVLAEDTLARAETLGLRELRARSEYVLAAAMRLAGNTQGPKHYTAALQLLDEMAREDGSQKLLERADLKAIHAECVRWSKTP
jgi:ATP/maltotriose-dependent transcriptional regulator MalT